MILVAFVFGVLLLAWMMAAVVLLGTVAIAVVRAIESRSGHPGRFLDRDAQFLREIGIRL